ncbi:MAG: prepilin-type N-terminal cleavage/methylation domain-containing protein [Clostridia bacterium]
MLQTLYKARNKKGFTLMEMLIVVAIIAILVAIAIPVFSSSLDKAKKATDQANIRSAIALASVQYLDDQTKTGDYYLTNDGKLTKIIDSKAYIIQADGETPYICRKKEYIKVTVDNTGKVTFTSVSKTTTP